MIPVFPRNRAGGLNAATLSHGLAGVAAAPSWVRQSGRIVVRPKRKGYRVIGLIGAGDHRFEIVTDDVGTRNIVDEQVRRAVSRKPAKEMVLSLEE